MLDNNELICALELGQKEGEMEMVMSGGGESRVLAAHDL